MTDAKQVTLVADRGETIKRILVSVENGVYFVCRAEEFEAAMRDNREPTCIGFRREYVVDMEAA